MSSIDDDAIKDAVSSFASLFGNTIKDLFSGEIDMEEAINRMPIQKLKTEGETEISGARRGDDTNSNVKQTINDDKEVTKTL